MSAFLFTFPTGDTSRPAEKLIKVGIHLYVPCATPTSRFAAEGRDRVPATSMLLIDIPSKKDAAFGRGSQAIIGL